MNRHRQERETETLNRARQLVYSNDNMGALNLGLRDQKPEQYFTDSFPHEPSLPYMDSLTMPTPILTQPSSFPSPSPPPPFFSSSPTPPSLASNNPISLPACFLPLHYSSQILPSRMNDLVNRHHVSSGSPHRQLQEQQQNSAARDFLSGLARSGETVGYYQDKRVSWGSTHD
ncbi:zinc finger protein STAMENLESS 1-like [Nymphaea colorata]|uniref:zinc finger protein STAMENLESS 1-like n=1 Tax=Nymphaea colorata TaxID=210225 RepID=UPI00214EBCB6|nr:zinc finger protein STAMENLESS 1-like [Nymphaea colorata]